MANKRTCLILVFLLLLPTPAISEVFMKRDEALKSAFPDADEIEKIEIYVSEEKARRIESIAKTKLDSRLYMVYKAKRDNETVGYAIIDTHDLRTMTETVMFVINPDGTLKYAEILAFFEPPDYLPGDNWIELFDGKQAGDGMRIGKEIPNISGATITATALSQAVRKILAVTQVTVLENKSPKGTAD